MEDRATLRISNQHIGKWLHHGVITEEHLKEAMLRMASVVDEQNSRNLSYRPIVVDKNSRGHAFNTAWNLVMNGVAELSGYAGPKLHGPRRHCKPAG